MSAPHLTVRNLPEELAAALRREKQRRGISLNQTVIDLLRHTLGLTADCSNGVARLAGTWTEKEHRRFLGTMKGFEEIDREFWK